MEDSKRSKRKRTQVSYYEPDPDDFPLDDEAENVAGPIPAAKAVVVDDIEDEQEDEDEEEESDDEFSPNKKLKAAAQAKAKAKNKNKNKSKKNKKDNKPFPFLTLPPEIRNLIYRYVLVEDEHRLSLVSTQDRRTAVRGWMEKTQYTRNDSFHTVKQKTKDRFHTCLHPKILTVCRQINQEATAVLYGQMIYLEHPVALLNFLSDIGPTNRSLLQGLVIYGWYNSKPAFQLMLYPALSLLSSATNLKSLIFDRRPEESDDIYNRHPCVNDFWKDARVLYQGIDAVRGKGTAASLVMFGQRVFGTAEDIQDKPEGVQEREDEFRERLEKLRKKG